MSRMKMHAITALCAALIAAQPAAAGEVIVGLGVDDVFDQTGTEAAAIALEYHFDPFHERATFRLSPAIAIHADTDGDLWAGVGIASVKDFRDGWFLEGSLLAGYYDQGSSGTPLGHEVEFRSLIGFGRWFDDRHGLSVAIDHKSNSGLGDTNPGSETLSLRYRVRF